MNTPKNIKTIIYTVIGVLIVLGAFYAVNEYQKNNQPPKPLTLREIIQLNESDRIKALEERTKELIDEVSNLADTTEAGIKYAAYIQLAEAQIELGKYNEALESLGKIPEDKKGNSRTDAALIRAYKGIGDAVKARELSANSIAVYDEDPAVWLAHLQANDSLPNEELKALYLQAVSKTKSNIDIMISYAKFSEKIGDKVTAVAAWETAANVDPANEGKYREEISRLRQ